MHVVSFKGVCGGGLWCVWGGVFVLIRMHNSVSFKGMCVCGSVVKSFGCVGLFTDADAKGKCGFF